MPLNKRIEAVVGLVEPGGVRIRGRLSIAAAVSSYSPCSNPSIPVS